jgi:peptidyl-prolyl cis-trans isomerase SurA
MPYDRTKRHQGRLALGALLGLALVFLLSAPATAQIAALVNGDPITALDIAQRSKLHESFEHKKLSRKELLDELIDEKLKLHLAKRKGIVVSDKQVDASISRMARGNKVSAFEDAVKKMGVDMERFKTRVRADIAWRQVLEQTKPGVFQIRDADLVAILNAHGENAQTKGTQYTLQPIIFVVARHSPDATKMARYKAAEAFRARVLGCEEAVAQARAMPEVVVKHQIKHFSLDLNEQYRKLLDNTPDGKMTPPEVTNAGVELVAVCGRKEVLADISSRKEFRQELLTKRVSAFEKEYLAELRKQAIIEYR